jgi:hypothetical protein
VCASLWLAAAVALPGAVAAAQNGTGFVPQRSRPLKERVLPGRFLDKPSLAPAWSIPVDALGFAAPGPLYLGARYTMASLDFLDEDHLLFTFHVPGLLRRDSQEGDERQIRAVVLALPSGTVLSDKLWTVHDHERYLWMLNDGHFLLRDRDNLFESDTSLVLKPFLHFPGPLLWLDLDPAQRFLVTGSREPGPAASEPGNVPSPATASAPVSADEQESAQPPDYVLRILNRASGQVILVSRVRETIHLPINSDGYLESLRGPHDEWELNLNDFTGGSRILGSVESACVPGSEFVSEREVLVTACSDNGEDRLVAMTTDGRSLWANRMPESGIWPQLTMAPGGLRIAREILVVSHEVNAFSPLGMDDIKGQEVTIFDAATGDVALETPASPILDAGGNVAISSSGRRVAVVDAGAIQVFELPAPPPLPDAGQGNPAR